jgi:sugar phosphate isomerase/epimerase
MQPIIASYNFCDQDFAAFLRNSAAAGFKNVAVGFFAGYLDLDLLDLTTADEKWLNDQLAAHDLSLVAIFMGGADILADGGLEGVIGRMENSARFGIDTVDMGSFSFDGKTADQIAAEEKLFVERIRQAGDRAGELGLTICLETHGGFTGDTDSCLHAMAAINHERVKLAYDPANFHYYEGKDPTDRLEQLCPFIGHTHLKDHRGAKENPDFPLVGEGQTDYETILPTLWKCGYRGNYTLERAPGDTDAERAESLRKAYQFITRLLPGD